MNDFRYSDFSTFPYRAKIGITFKLYHSDKLIWSNYSDFSTFPYRAKIGITFKLYHSDKLIWSNWYSFKAHKAQGFRHTNKKGICYKLTLAQVLGHTKYF